MIRRATAADSALISELGRTAFVDAFAADPRNRPDDMRAYLDHAFAPATVEGELADPTVIFLLEQQAGVTTGYAKLNTSTREACVMGEKPIELARLYARAGRTGEGIGTRLLDACLAVAREGSHDVMWLGVWEFNPGAVKFYERHGFLRVGEHTFLLGSDPQVDWVFQRRV